MLSASLGPVADHLWQSTIAVAVVAVLALALKRNRAEIRHALWMAASIKFLIPFAMLMTIGQQLDWRAAPSVQPEVSVVVDAVGRPFSVPEHGSSLTASAPSVSVTLGITTEALLAVWALGTTVLVVAWVVRWRRVARIVREATPLHDGRVLDALARIGARLPVVSSAAQMEPGVFGIRRPLLVWPHGIERALTDAQIEAIAGHEIAHVRRRDNLLAALHMAVQGIFWFHPIVWWVGTRLVDERERACDEAVVRAGSDPHVYAESILKTCQYFVESPLACVAGVTGSDLKKRIEQIMRHDTQSALGLVKRLVLGASLVAAIAGPVTIGILTGPRLAAQVVPPPANAPTFEVASIKPNDGSGGRMGGRGGPGRIDMTNVPLRRLIRQAYNIHESQVVGGPEWIGTQGFDVNATIAGNVTPETRRLMMQTLLRDRFKLTFHAERRDLPIYALIVARSDGKLGEGLRRTPEGECLPRGAGLGAPPSTPGPQAPPASPFDPDAKAACGSLIFGPGRLLAHGVDIDMLANALGNLPAITAFNRIVQNQTGLAGSYDFDFKFANEFAGRGPGFPPPGAGPAGGANPGDEPAVVTALQEQLGLKLDARRANVDVLVIESVQKPGEN